MTVKDREEINNRLLKMEKSLDKVVYLLESDSATNQMGVVEKLHDVERRLSNIETNNKITKAKIGVIAAVGGFVSTFFYFLVKQVAIFFFDR